MICVLTYILEHIFWTGYAYYDRLQLDHGSDAHKKQTWRVKINSSDGTFLFESMYWKRGNYLNANEKSWARNGGYEYYLYCDSDGIHSPWKLTSSVI